MKDECYEFIKGANNKINIVGFGSYGEVKLALNTETGDLVAIKMIHGRNAKDQIDVHHKLDHPSIIKLLNYYYEKDKNITYMVLEYAEGGTLYNRIRYGLGQLQKDKIKKYFRDVCKAVEYLHSLKYMHRDIKPENILLTKDDHAKLCDFGFAAILQYRSTLCGTYEYMAPEMIQEKPYDYKVDIWALGILLFELIKGTAPFRGQNGQEVINQMRKNIVFSNNFEKDEIDLIKKILRVNADNRPTATQILEHPYFQDGKSESSQKQTIKIIGVTSINNEGISFKPDPKPEPIVYQATKQDKYEKYEKQEKPEKLERPETRERQDKVEKTDKREELGKEKDGKQQFQHYVPHGVKTSLGSMKSTSSQPPASISSSGTSYQSHQSSFTSSASNQPQSLNNPNTSIDSTFSSRQQMPIPSFLNNQKISQNPNMIPTPGTSIKYQNQAIQNQVVQNPVLNPSNNPALWRKH